MTLPLQGLTVIEFSQYMAGPYAGLRLADLGARVIKIERPGTGDACRQLATKNLFVDGDSLVFHSINRNKESYTANLKDPMDLERVKGLLRTADVMTHNFRPGVMEKIGLDYDSVRGLNPRLIYGEVTGYGRSGPWKDKPGQDLLAQSMSGLTFLTGDADDPPITFGLAATCFAARTSPKGFSPPSYAAAGPATVAGWRSACWNHSLIYSSRCSQPTSTMET